jgi:hypothetical protein
MRATRTMRINKGVFVIVSLRDVSRPQLAAQII